MRSAGLSGKGKGGAPITRRKPKGPDLRPDLVNREFRAPGPNRGCGWRTLLMCARRKALCTQLLSLVCTPDEPLVVISLLQVLESVYSVAGQNIKRFVVKQQKRIIAAAEKHIEDPVDLESVKKAAWEEDLLKDPPPDSGV